MKSKDLAILSGALALVAVIFWQIGQDKASAPVSPPASISTTGTATSPKPAASASTSTPAGLAGQTSPPVKSPAPAPGTVFKTGDKFTLPSGLSVEILLAGDGAEAIAGHPVLVNYTGTFANGTAFDSSLNPGRTPFSFNLGGGGVIKGWDEGVAGMRIGEKRKLVIPSNLAYGANGRPGIPPNAELTFVIDLLDVK